MADKINRSIDTHVKEEEAQYPLVSHNVEHVARLRIDDRQTMDAVSDQRVNGVK